MKTQQSEYVGRTLLGTLGVHGDSQQGIGALTRYVGRNFATH